MATRTTKRKKAIANDQDLLFKKADFKVVEEIKFGESGTYLRLTESEYGKRYIQCWSSLSNDWHNMYIYNIDEEWQKWKKTHAGLYPKRRKNERTVGRSLQLGGTTDNPKRTTRRKTSNESAKRNRKSNGK